MAKEDVALIAGNLLGVSKKVKEKNRNAKQSRKMGRKVKEAVQRLGQKKDKSAAEVTLLERARAKPSVDYHERCKKRLDKLQKACK
jgi:hypothetical protein